MFPKKESWLRVLPATAKETDMGLRIPKGLCRLCLKPVEGRRAYHEHCSPPSKFHNRRATATAEDGSTLTFDSRLEARRYGELSLLERQGLITDLRLQVPYALVVNDILIGNYIADFVYEEEGQVIVEDCKGVRTREYVIKKKLMRALHNIVIKEIGRS